MRRLTVILLTPPFDVRISIRGFACPQFFKWCCFSFKQRISRRLLPERKRIRRKGTCAAVHHSFLETDFSVCLGRALVPFSAFSCALFCRSTAGYVRRICLQLHSRCSSVARLAPSLPPSLLPQVARINQRPCRVTGILRRSTPVICQIIPMFAGRHVASAR